MNGLTDRARERARACVLLSAAGDALGAGYEGRERIADDVPIRHAESEHWSAGEWTDDTAMAAIILRAADQSPRGFLSMKFGYAYDDHAIAQVARDWVAWYQVDGKGIGRQTRSVLARVDVEEQDDVEFMRGMFDAAEEQHRASGKMSAGNGSLMRTHAVAVATLGAIPGEVSDIARVISDLTHYDNAASQACILWTHLVRSAILTGRPEFDRAIEALPAVSQSYWRTLLSGARHVDPSFYAESNGWVVDALCGAWSAFTGARSAPEVIERAIRGGGDTDTVAAIAGGLAGATYGLDDVPEEWITPLHGYPKMTGADLAEIVDRL